MHLTSKPDLKPNPLGAALTVFTMIAGFFTGCSLVAFACHLIETV